MYYNSDLGGTRWYFKKVIQLMYKILAKSLYVGAALIIKDTDISAAKTTKILISGVSKNYKQSHVSSGHVVTPNKFAANLRRKQ